MCFVVRCAGDNDNTSVSVFSFWRFLICSHSADAISPEALASGLDCSLGRISSIERATALAVTLANVGWGCCVVSLRMFPIIVLVKRSSFCSMVRKVEAMKSC